MSELPKREDTKLTLETGTPIRLADVPCKKCGCFEVFPFDCNCGAVHSDCCYHCGGFTDYDHKTTIEEDNARYPELPPALRCYAGRIEHEHAAYAQADAPDKWTDRPEAN